MLLCNVCMKFMYVIYVCDACIHAFFVCNVCMEFMHLFINVLHLCICITFV